MSPGTGPDTAPRKPSGQPPHVLAAWMADAIHEVHTEHLPRVVQLRDILEAQAQAWEAQELEQTFHALLLAARGLDLQALAIPAWWRRLWPWGRRPAQDFEAAHRAMLAAAGDARQRLDALAREWRPIASASRRAVVELDLEHRAIAGETGDAVHWLAELTEHLSAGPVPGKEERMRKWAQAAQQATQALKRLDTIGDLVGETVLVGRTLFERRTIWLEQLRRDLDAFDREWCPRVAALSGGHCTAQQLEPAAEVHARLLDGFERTDSAVMALRIEAQGFGQLLSRLGEQFAAPGPSPIEDRRPAPTSSSASRE
ncbi:hypothetical protein [Caenimonas aquaedulcis]|uniref:Uncharacterized protein n=1 Tax=Caenimonas aquaedulcis TaxID=2793270 RepID=A0A931MGR1_9BURK|nr:hypothetical protein [Caenimonas aquaedulcis]MBG9388426.1 hypothetical protein [Caenimonas aquaedulcis]